MRRVYKILVGKPGEKSLLRRPRRRWEDNIRMDLRELSGLVQGPVAGSCEHGNEPSGSVKGG